MESWRRTFRLGVVPQLSRRALEALRDALERDDPRLLQGATCTPPPLHCMAEEPVQAACLLAYPGWQGEGLTTVKEVEEYFARVCFEIDRRLGESAGCHWLINHYDEVPRVTMRADLLSEVRLALASHAGPAEGVA